MNDQENNQDPLFFVDALMGRLLSALLGVFVFCLLIAAGYLWEFLT